MRLTIHSISSMISFSEELRSWAYPVVTITPPTIPLKTYQVSDPYMTFSHADFSISCDDKSFEYRAARIDGLGHDVDLPECMSYFSANKTFNIYTRDNS